MTLVAEEQATTKPPPFPVFATIGEVYLRVIVQCFSLFRAAWLPLLVYVLLESLDVVLRQAAIEHRFHPETTNGSFAIVADVLQRSYFFSFVTGVLAWGALTMSAITFHRFVLLGERQRGWRSTGLDFGPREAQFFLSAVKVGLLTVLPFTAAYRFALTYLREDMSLFVNWVFITSLVGFGVAGLAVRVGLMLPHAALGHASDLGFVWRHSKGQTLRLTVFSFFFFLPMIVFNIWIARLVYVDFNLPTMLAVYLSVLPDWIIGTMVSVTMLSVAYREIIGLPDTDNTDGQGDTAPETAPATPTPA